MLAAVSSKPLLFQLLTISIEGRVVSTNFKKDTVSLNIPAFIADISATPNQLDSSIISIAEIPKFKKVISNVCFPLKTIKATSLFGARFHPVLKEFKFHTGLDLRALYEGVYAFSSGVVERTFNDPSSGLCVVINHGSDIQTVYAHLSYIVVAKGQSISAGSLIAISGNTGMSTAPHLYFAIKYKNTPVDPASVFNFINYD